MIDTLNSEPEAALLPLEIDNSTFIPNIDKQLTTYEEGYNKKLSSVGGHQCMFKFTNAGNISVTVAYYGITHRIDQENLPKDFSTIQSSAHLDNYLKNASVNMLELNNGKLKIDINHKLLGGGGLDIATHLITWSIDKVIDYHKVHTAAEVARILTTAWQSGSKMNCCLNLVLDIQNDYDKVKNSPHKTLVNVDLVRASNNLYDYVVQKHPNKDIGKTLAQKVISIKREITAKAKQL